MKNIVLATVIVASAVLAACSSAPDYSGLEAGGSEVVAAPAASTGTPTTTASAQPTPLPLPVSGPGSAASTAHQFFVDQVYPSLSPCATCHGTGANGAPIFLQSNAATAYQTMDIRGMIQPQSSLLSKGQHLGPALSAAQLALVQQWLDKEAKERVGQAAPVNILDKIGDCLDETMFNAIGFDKLRTKPGTNEDTNTCTGCNNVQCNRCHTAGDGNFYMAVGSTLDTTTFAQTKKAQFVVKYIGLNGTDPVPSNAIKLKSDSTVLDPMHYHPMFTLDADMLKGIDDFARAAIFKYKAGTCGK